MWHHCKDESVLYQSRSTTVRSHEAPQAHLSSSAQRGSSSFLNRTSSAPLREIWLRLVPRCDQVMLGDLFPSFGHCPSYDPPLCFVRRTLIRASNAPWPRPKCTPTPSPHPTTPSSSEPQQSLDAADGRSSPSAGTVPSAHQYHVID